MVRTMVSRKNRYFFLHSSSLNKNTNSLTLTRLLTIFYIGYITAQPSTLLWKVIPPHIYVTCLTLIWSIVSLLQATTHTFAGMMVLRLILGMSETAYGPGTPYYYSFFYKKNEIGLRQGLFLG